MSLWYIAGMNRRTSSSRWAALALVYWTASSPVMASEPRLFPVDRLRSEISLVVRRPKLLGLLSSSDTIGLARWFVALRLDPMHWSSSGLEAAITPTEFSEQTSEIRVSTDSWQRTGQGESDTGALPATLTVRSRIKWNGREKEIQFPLMIRRAENDSYRIEGRIPLKASDFGANEKNMKDDLELHLDLTTQPETQFAWTDRNSGRGAGE